MGRFVDETGNRYGRLLVLRHVGSSKCGNAEWLCRCDCGKEKIIRGGGLRNGGTKSCGCLQKEVAHMASLPEGEAAFNALLCGMKWAARRSGNDWELSREDAHKLTSRPCYYCGCLPSQFWGNARYNGMYVYNGLDRVNNDLGYTLENVVPCCRDCNYMKRKMTKEDFLGKVLAIYKHSIRGDLSDVDKTDSSNTGLD